MHSAIIMAALLVNGPANGQLIPGGIFGAAKLDRVNRELHGQLLDFTHNHGRDRRIWSPALCQRRDLYVYLPPCYDRSKQYPMSIFLHGAGQDEQFFMQTQVKLFDQAIAKGEMPPVIIAAPDGSNFGRPSAFKPATFWANSRAGNFEDYLMTDVWNFLMENFSIHPAREYHALVGASMGGSAAYALAIKHRDRVKVAMGFMPLLNLRYVDGQGNYRSNFDPTNFGFREEMNPRELLGRKGFIVLRFGTLFTPMYGKGNDAIASVSAINPLEIMERENLQNGELDLFIGYGAKDEFNVAAQVESFLYFAHKRGVEVGVVRDPNGRHDLRSGLRLMPAAQRWAAEHTPVTD